MGAGSWRRRRPSLRLPTPACLGHDSRRRRHTHTSTSSITVRRSWSSSLSLPCKSQSGRGGLWRAVSRCALIRSRSSSHPPGQLLDVAVGLETGPRRRRCGEKAPHRSRQQWTPGSVPDVDNATVACRRAATARPLSQARTSAERPQHTILVRGW